jgi:hypothetical protein
VTLRFHRTLYAGTAIDAALQRFAQVAQTTFARSEEPEYFVVEITSTTDARTKKIARELGNFALGLTIEQGGPDREPQA